MASARVRWPPTWGAARFLTSRPCCGAPSGMPPPARGTEHAASVLALLRSGLFDELPDLKVVVPMIGAAVFLFAGIAGQENERDDGWCGSSPRVTRRRLYVDTMGFDPAAIRFSLDLLGVEHVLLGSDWPIMPIMPRQRVEEVMTSL